MGKFAIIDDKSIVEDGLRDLGEAFEALERYKEEGFEFHGDVKIVEVHHIE